MKIETFGYIKEGRLKIVHEKRFKEDLRQAKDCDVQIIIKKRGKRSLPQNAYYHGVIVEEIRHRLKELGNTFDHDTVHEFLKQKFHSEKIVIPATGELIEVGQTTTKMNKDEFGSYIDRIIQWAAETLEIHIPEPGQQTDMFNQSNAA